MILIRRTAERDSLFLAAHAVTHAQAQTTFGTTTRQEFTTGFGLHTGAKTVFVDALSAGWLVRSFHLTAFLQKRTKNTANLPGIFIRFLNSGGKGTTIHSFEQIIFGERFCPVADDFCTIKFDRSDRVLPRCDPIDPHYKIDDKDPSALPHSFYLCPPDTTIHRTDT